VKKYSADKIRNIALFGHGGTGKTSVAEAMLFSIGAVDRLGRVDDGNTALDFDADEIKRGISIYLSTAPCEWKDHKINCLDVPGFMDFISEKRCALRVVEGSVLIVAAQAGVEVGLEKLWIDIEKKNLPRMIFVNKMDKENAEFYKVVSDLNESLAKGFVPVCIPIGSFENFSGYVDLVSQCAYKTEGGKSSKIDIPADMQDKVAELRESLIEHAAEGDDELLEKYLEEETLTDDEIKKGLKEAVRSGKVTPVLCGSAAKNIGADGLMDAIIEYIPSPVDAGAHEGVVPGTDDKIERKATEGEPFSALVFKTTTDPYVGKLTYLRVFSGILKSDSMACNPNREKDEKMSNLHIMMGKNQESTTEVGPGDMVTVAKLQDTTTGDTLCDKDNPIRYPDIDFPKTIMSMAIYPKSKGDEDKLSTGLSKIGDEDPTLKLFRDPATKEAVLSGMGELHLEIVRDRLKRKFGVEVDLVVPRIPYMETIKSRVNVEGKYKKQSGGRGQYGHCWLTIEPSEKGKLFEFVDKIVGGVIPKNYIPAIEKGIKKTMEDGVVAGYPITDLKVTVYDGSYHTVDSSDMAFQIAGSMGLKKGMVDAHPVLLEPIYDVEVVVPEQYMGDVIGDINGKRGKILGMDPLPKGLQNIKAQAPLGEMQRYAIDLRSMTQGRGVFSLDFSHYEEVPTHIAEGIIAASKKEE